MKKQIKKKVSPKQAKTGKKAGVSVLDAPDVAKVGGTPAYGQSWANQSAPAIQRKKKANTLTSKEPSIQRADLTDDQVLTELKNPESEYGIDELEGIARVHSNANFESSLGEFASTMASDILSTLQADIDDIYESTLTGYEGAIAAIQGSVQREEERNAMIKAVVYTTLAMFGAFIPVMNARVDAALANIPAGVRISGYNGITGAIKTMSTAEFKFLYEGLKQTTRNASTSVNPGRSFTDWNLELQQQNSAMKRASRNSGYSILLAASMKMKAEAPEAPLGKTDAGIFLGATRKAIREALFPDYAREGLTERSRISQISDYAKKQFLRNVAMQGSYLQDSTQSGVTMRNDSQGKIGGYAMDALEHMGVDFGDLFQMPEEYAYEVTQSRLLEWGIKMDEDDKLAPQTSAYRKKRLKSERMYWDAYISDVPAFLAQLSYKRRSDHQGHAYYRISSGPIKQILDRYPMEKGGWFLSPTITRYRMDLSNLSPKTKVRIYLDPADLVYAKGGKIADYRSVDLDFKASGNVNVQDQYVSSNTMRGALSAPSYSNHVLEPVSPSETNRIELRYRHLY